MSEIPQSLGKYHIVQELGRGSFGAVYLAEDTSLNNRRVALKVLYPQLVVDPGTLRLFQQEAGTMAQLEHPNIVPVYEAGELEGRRFIAMRYVPGQTLADVIKTQGPQPLGRVADWLAQIGSALDYAHRRGVLHRDIKPSNVLLDDEGRAMLSDFGLAKAVNASGGSASTQERDIMSGTARYMAPEQARGAPVPQSDLYGAGVLVYELLTAKVPFDGTDPFAIAFQHVSDPVPPPRQLRPELPAAVDAVVLKALAKNPADRYASGADMAMAFRQAVAAGAAPLVSPPPQVRGAATPQGEGAGTSPVGPAGGDTAAAELARRQEAEQVRRAQEERQRQLAEQQRLQAAQAQGPLPTKAGTVPVVAGVPLPRRRGCWKWGLIGVAAVVVITVIAILAQGTGPSRPSSPTTAPGRVTVIIVTPEPAATATPLPAPSETPAPTADVAATVEAVLTSAAGTGSSQFLMVDTFDDPSSSPTNELTVDDGTNVHRYFDQGTYHVQVKKTNWLAWGSYSATFSDFDLEVMAQFVNLPSEGELGLLYRMQDADNSYMWVISSNGQYKVSKQIAGAWTTLLDWTSDPSILTGTQVNYLDLLCHGPDMSLYVNNTYLTTVTDSTFSSGQLALLVGAFDQAGVEAAFDDLYVYPPQ